MKAVLFDMDGVLVDVSRSYRLAIARTVAHFSGKKLSAKRIQLYKDEGGLNNDWQLTHRALRDLGVDVPFDAVVAFFQRVYLGEGCEGLIRNEGWLLREEVAARLARQYPLGVVTGRPRAEAERALHRAGMRCHFGAVITMDDLPQERQKPHPDGLLLALKTLKASGGWYLGDTIDDVLAAKGAGLVPVGVVQFGRKEEQVDRRRLLLEYGASVVLGDVNCVEEALW